MNTRNSKELAPRKPSWMDFSSTNNEAQEKFWALIKLDPKMLTLKIDFTRQFLFNSDLAYNSGYEKES